MTQSSSGPLDVFSLEIFFLEIVQVGANENKLLGYVMVLNTASSDKVGIHHKHQNTLSRLE
jgi:hypothetical protein